MSGNGSLGRNTGNPIRLLKGHREFELESGFLQTPSLSRMISIRPHAESCVHPKLCKVLQRQYKITFTHSSESEKHESFFDQIPFLSRRQAVIGPSETLT